jgi:hypothetical protein
MSHINAECRAIINSALLGNKNAKDTIYAYGSQCAYEMADELLIIINELVDKNKKLTDTNKKLNDIIIDMNKNANNL